MNMPVNILVNMPVNITMNMPVNMPVSMPVNMPMNMPVKINFYFIKEPLKVMELGLKVFLYFL